MFAYLFQIVGLIGFVAGIFLVFGLGAALIGGGVLAVLLGTLIEIDTAIDRDVE